jgi:hypothetical protein
MRAPLEPTAARAASTILTGSAGTDAEPAPWDLLRVARGILADIAHHQPEHAQAACCLVITLSDDIKEREDAYGLLPLLATAPVPHDILLEDCGDRPCATS